jgi:peptide/nickel transport system substrate-binding protein
MNSYRLVMLAIMLSLALAACGGGGDQEEVEAPDAEAQVAEAPDEDRTGDEENSEPVQVRIGSDAPPDSLNPGMAQLLSAHIIFQLVYDSLFHLQLDGTYAPALVENTQVSEDGTVWTFSLRDGITFHDGELLTAEDVVYSYNLYKTREDFPF